eukprot:m.465632 g.465632  ORF g.465632 m.465632 type:complete len:65 (+) comp57050_c0_seq51:171-365(+)
MTLYMSLNVGGYTELNRGDIVMFYVLCAERDLVHHAELGRYHSHCLPYQSQIRAAACFVPFQQI